MEHRRATMVFSAAILVGTIALFSIVPKGFIPTQDTGAIYGTIEAAEGTSYEQMVEHLKRASEVVPRHPSVAGVQVNSGGGGPWGGGANQGRISVYLKPRHDRDDSADEVIRELMGPLSQLPGVRAFLNNPPAIRIEGRGSKSQYQFTLQGSDLQQLYAESNAFEDRMRELPGLTDVTSDLQIRNPQLRIEIDRDRAAALGLDVSQVQNALYNAFGSRQISTILGPTTTTR
jgi:HAE1 family hydrophobic/amphiphilic exporter-1